MAEAAKPDENLKLALESFTYDPTIYGDQFKDDKTKDMAIAFGGGDQREVRVHRAIMKLNSPHWHQFFTKYPEFALLILPDCKYEDVEDVIKILYKGRDALLRVPEGRVAAVVKTANRIKLRLFSTYDKKL